MTGKATRPYAGPAYPPWWTVSESYVHQGKTVVRGQQLAIEGRRGAFTFVNHTVAPPRPGSGRRTTREWITVIDTRSGPSRSGASSRRRGRSASAAQADLHYQDLLIFLVQAPTR